MYISSEPWSVQGNLTIPDDVDKACEGAHCVWHVAALVGPFHAKEAYMAVNYQGSLNVLEACRYVHDRGYQMPCVRCSAPDR